MSAKTSKRGAVWGVRCLFGWAIGQRMAKRAAIICSVLLPLVSFGGLFPDFVEFVDNPTNIIYMRVYTYNSNASVVYTDINGTKYTLPSYLISYVKIGVQLNTFSDKIVHPLGDNEVYQTTPSVDYPLSRYYDRSRYYCLDYLPDFSQALNICCNLIVQGYRSPVVEIMKEVPNNIYCNFRVGDVFRDVLTGTNIIFRSQLLSHLSNVNGSLQTLALSLGSISTDYKSVNDIYLNPTYQNLVDSMASPLSTSSGSSSIYGNVQNLLGGNNPYMGQNSQSEVASAIAELSRRNLQAVVAATLDPDSEFFAQPINDILADQDKFAQAIRAGGGASGIGSIARDVKRLSTNDWVSAVTNQLANNRASITNQLAHMFDETQAGTGVGDKIASIAGSSSDISSNTRSIDSRLANGITVAVVNSGNTSVGVHLDGPVNIDSTQWQTLSSPIGGLADTLDSLYGDLSTFYGWGDSTIDWASYFRMMSDFKAQNHSDLASLSNSLLASLSITSNVDRIYDYLAGYQSNSLYQIVSSLTNSLDDYYFTRFRRANEFIDENDLPFSISAASDTIFGRGFDEGEFSNLNWFSRMELLLYQLQRVNDTTNTLEYADIEGELDDSVDDFNSAGTDFVNASRRVVGLFGFITRFADSVKLAFQNSASPSTSGIVLLQGGSWLVNEPLVLNIPISVQNALRLVFQCIWYLSAAVIGWRIVSATWDKVTGLIRWLWSIFDV